MSTVNEHFASLKAMKDADDLAWTTPKFQYLAALFLAAHFSELHAAWSEYSARPQSQREGEG
jgi:hypothetical protein